MKSISHFSNYFPDCAGAAQLSGLPVCHVLGELCQALRQHDAAILEAPPGAGKTTAIPLALLKENWLQHKKILVLEPRRLAAKSAASRMAQLLGEPVGETVGYRVKQDTKVSKRTRIEVITEAVLLRMLDSDPELSGVGLLIFDEFHERHLDADAGLILSLFARDLYGSDGSSDDGSINSGYRLLIMSATLQGIDFSTVLPDAPTLVSEGVCYPVDIHYTGAYRYDQDIVTRVVRAIEQALVNHQGHILAFLPGRADIHRAERLLQQLLLQNSGTALGKGIVITPLHGGLSLADQRRAVATDQLPPNARAVLLSTAIAETSLTINGVEVVVDSGLSRQSVYNPNIGMSRLVNVRTSQATANQRAGRAGRTAPGHCYRCWSAEQQGQLTPQLPAEISQADLSTLVLQCAHWGITAVEDVVWLTAPSQGAWSQAQSLLVALGALSAEGVSGELTPLGHIYRQLPLHPRLARLLVLSHVLGEETLGCRVAALLTEVDGYSGAKSVSLQDRLDAWQGKAAGSLSNLPTLTQQAKSFDRALSAIKSNLHALIDDLSSTGNQLTLAECRLLLDVIKTPPASSKVLPLLLMAAYPDRIAKRRNAVDGASNESGTVNYQLASGRAVYLSKQDSLSRYDWLVVAEAGGSDRQKQAADQIYKAVMLPPVVIQSYAGELMSQSVVTQWAEDKDEPVCVSVTRLGAIEWSRENTPIPDSVSRQDLLLQALSDHWHWLSWPRRATLLQQRVQCLRQHACLPDGRAILTEDELARWPDISDKWLKDHLSEWLAPYLQGVASKRQLSALPLYDLMLGQLTWQQQQQLEQLLPVSILLPAGVYRPIDYSDPLTPQLSVKLQELYGMAETPAVLRGALPLRLELLSPAQRPIQVTADLATFWQGSYRDVQKDMKSRYPKHDWPDDPANSKASTVTTKSARQKLL